MADIVTTIVYAIIIVSGSGVATEALIRGLSGLVRRSGGHAGLARSIREGFTAIWITSAAAGVLAVTGVASEFSFITISGIAGLTVSLHYRIPSPTLSLEFYCSLTAPFDLTILSNTAE